MIEPSPQDSVQTKAKIEASTTNRRSGGSGSRDVRAHSHSPDSVTALLNVCEDVLGGRGGVLLFGEHSEISREGMQIEKKKFCRKAISENYYTVLFHPPSGEAGSRKN